MQRSAVPAGHQHEVTQTPVAHDAGAEAGDDLSTLLGAGQFREAVIDHIPAVVFVKDARDFRFILLNRAGEEFLGVSRQAIIGKTDHDVFPKEEADQFVARDCEVLKSRHVRDHRGGAGSHPAQRIALPAHAHDRHLRRQASSRNIWWASPRT